MRPGFRRYQVYAELVDRPITWARSQELQDSSALFFGSKAWYLGPHLLPNSPRIQNPWAYVTDLPNRIPFVVRVAYGYDFNGQAGALGVHYYLTLFGAQARVRDRIIGLF